ncbi:MAG: hypothetical protein DRQ49_12240 [Gammaproteobacteria bacterium]|nr:MAG: hypothetical protein DRQ49_12240 [Gammaproteobacteria bacterium]
MSLTHINNIKPNAISPNIYSGESLFFTLVTEQRRKLFIDETNVELLYQAFRHVMKKRHFAIDAIVVLPEHLHGIWTLPPNDADFSTRWRLIKTGFTKHCDNKYKVTPKWQHRYWEHLLRDELDFEHHINYIHYNPVKHDYVNKPLSSLNN